MNLIEQSARTELLAAFRARILELNQQEIAEFLTKWIMDKSSMMSDMAHNNELSDSNRLTAVEIHKFLNEFILDLNNFTKDKK